MVLVVAVFFSHMYGVIFCAILIGSHELTALWRERGGGLPPLRRVLARAALPALALAPAAMLYLGSPLAGVEAGTVWQPLGAKLAGLAGLDVAFRNYLAALDRATALVVVGGAAAMLWLRAADLHPGGAVALLACLAAYLAVPSTFKGGAWFDTRFAVMAGLLVFAAVRPRLHAPAARRVGLLLAGLLLLRTAVVAAVWVEHRTDLADLRAATAEVPPGGKVLVAIAEVPRARGHWSQYRQRVVARLANTVGHMPALLTIERRAFWPLMYVVRGQQPLRVLPPYDRLNPGANGPAHPRMLAEFGHAGVPPLDPARLPPWWRYLADWQRDFDYLLVLNADGAGEALDRLLPDVLEPRRRSGIAALFRIHPPGGEPARRGTAP
jgi:hypothetical protein